MDKLGEATEERKTPEQYFKEELGENSEDFLMLERMVEETNGKIGWEGLKKYTKIENGKVEGIYREKNLDLEGISITSLGKVKKVGGDLYLRGTDIKSLQKINKVIGGVYLYGVSSLKDLGELEEVGGHLILEGTNITSLGKVKKVGGHLNLEGTNITSLGKVKKVGGYLNIRGTSIELQLEVMRNIESKKLIVDGDIYFGGDIKGIEKLLKNKKIPGNLDLKKLSSLKDLGELEEVGGYLNLEGINIMSLGKVKKVGGDLYLRGTSIELQLEVMKKVKNGELVVNLTIYYDDLIEQYLTEEGKLNFNNFEERYGTRVDEIEGDQQGQIGEFLEYIKKVEIEDLSKEIVKILKENITQEKMKEKVAKLNAEYKIYIQKIDGYLDDKN